MRLAVTLAVLLAAGAASADEHELAVDVTVGVDGGWTVNPMALAPTAEQSSIAVLPRLNLQAKWGLTHNFEVGGGLEASYWPAVMTTGATVAAVDGGAERKGNLFAQHLVVAAPIVLSARLDLGFIAEPVVELQAGPLVGAWLPGWLQSDEATPRTILQPQDLAPVIWPGAMLRVQAVVETRLFDFTRFAVVPSLSASWAGTPAVLVGLGIRASWVDGIGPL